MKNLTVLLLLLPLLASAEPEKWLKYQVNPEQLNIVATSEPDCPMSTADIEKETQNVLIRSRIKPLEGGGVFGYPYLSVSVNCLPLPDSSKAFAYIRIDFVQIVTLNATSTTLRPETAKKLPGADMVIKARLGEELYGGAILITDKAFLKSAIKEKVEDFLADYLRANFDLGDSE